MSNFLKFICVGCIIFCGCEKSTSDAISCDDTFPLFGNNIEWELTDVPPVECKWMLSKIAYKGEFYYTLGNYCVDMAAYVAKCDGVSIFDRNTRLANRILEKGKSLGLVAVEK